MQYRHRNYSNAFLISIPVLRKSWLEDCDQTGRIHSLDQKVINPRMVSIWYRFSTHRLATHPNIIQIIRFGCSPSPRTNHPRRRVPIIVIKHNTKVKNLSSVGNHLTVKALLAFTVVYGTQWGTGLNGTEFAEAGAGIIFRYHGRI